MTLQGKWRAWKSQLIRVEVDTNGQLLSVYDKEKPSGKSYHRGQRGNVVLMAEDPPLNYDAGGDRKVLPGKLSRKYGGVL